MDKPKIAIQLDWMDKFFEGLGLIGAILLIALPICYYGILPETIPRHFDFNGNPDGFSQKSVLWFLPIIGIATYIGLALLNKRPHIFNYPHKITPENAERQYIAATKMIRVLNTVIVSFFTVITYFTIQISLGNQSKINGYFIAGFVIFIVTITGYYVFKSLNTNP